MLISLLWENSLGNYSGRWRWKPGGGPRWYGTHPPQGPLALMGSQEPKYSSPMGPIRVPRSGDAGGKARVLSLARPTRLILGGSLGDTHPCSTFAGNLFLLFSSKSLSGTFAEFHSDLVTRFCNASFFFLYILSLHKSLGLGLRLNSSLVWKRMNSHLCNFVYVLLKTLTTTFRGIFRIH